MEPGTNRPYKSTLPAIAGVLNLGVSILLIACGGVETVLHNSGVTSGDAANPYGSLVEAADGSFSGMTLSDLSTANGAMFKL